MTPESCPRYETCSAPICPLDARWRHRHYGCGEAVCGFVLESVKMLGAATVRRQLGDEAATAVIQAAPEMAQRFPFIAHRLSRAAAQGSRIRAATVARECVQRSVANAA